MANFDAVIQIIPIDSKPARLKMPMTALLWGRIQQPS